MQEVLELRLAAYVRARLLPFLTDGAGQKYIKPRDIKAGAALLLAFSGQIVHLGCWGTIGKGLWRLSSAKALSKRSIRKL